MTVALSNLGYLLGSGEAAVCVVMREEGKVLLKMDIFFS